MKKRLFIITTLIFFVSCEADVAKNIETSEAVIPDTFSASENTFAAPELSEITQTQVSYSETTPEFLKTEKSKGRITFSNNRKFAEIDRFYDEYKYDALDYGGYNSLAQSVFKEDVENISVDNENPYLASQDGVLFSKDMTLLLRYPPEKKGDYYCVPKTVEYICGGAFANSKLKEIDMFDNVKIIGLNAFENCIELEDIKLSNSVNVICDGAFRGCSKLKEINLPENLTEVGSDHYQYANVFENCFALEKIFIPKNIRSFTTDFYGCDNLKEVIIDENNHNYKITDGVLSKTNNEGDYFIAVVDKNIISLSLSNYSFINKYALYGCDKLEEIIIEDGEFSPLDGMTMKYYYYTDFNLLKNLKKIIINSMDISIFFDSISEISDNIILYVLKNSEAEKMAIEFAVPYVYLP